MKLGIWPLIPHKFSPTWLHLKLRPQLKGIWNMVCIITSKTQKIRPWILNPLDGAAVLFLYLLKYCVFYWAMCPYFSYFDPNFYLSFCEFVIRKQSLWCASPTHMYPPPLTFWIWMKLTFLKAEWILPPSGDGGLDGLWLGSSNYESDWIKVYTVMIFMGRIN